MRQCALNDNVVHLDRGQVDTGNLDTSLRMAMQCGVDTDEVAQSEIASVSRVNRMITRLYVAHSPNMSLSQHC